MKILVSLLALFLLGGCATLKKLTTPAPAPTAATTAAPGRPLATLEVRRANAIEFFTGYDSRCQILSIDGAPADDTAELAPGNHTLTVSLTHLGQEYIGDVDLIIPEAKSYALKAKRKGDVFTLSIVDVADGQTLATSTASLTSHMKFLVFVVQK